MLTQLIQEIGAFVVAVPNPQFPFHLLGYSNNALVLIRLRGRKNHCKRSTFARTGTREDVSTMILYNLFAHSQTDTSPLVLGL